MTSHSGQRFCNSSLHEKMVNTNEWEAGWRKQQKIAKANKRQCVHLCVISYFDDAGEPREWGSKTASVCWATWVAHTANSATNTTPAELNNMTYDSTFCVVLSHGLCAFYLVSKQNGICPSLRKWVGGSLTVAWLLVCCKESTQVREHSLLLLLLSALALTSTATSRCAPQFLSELNYSISCNVWKQATASLMSLTKFSSGTLS